MSKTTKPTKSKPITSVDHELDGLKSIVKELNKQNTDAQGRIFKYLKNRFSSAWPGETY